MQVELRQMHEPENHPVSLSGLVAVAVSRCLSWRGRLEVRRGVGWLVQFVFGDPEHVRKEVPAHMHQFTIYYLNAGLGGTTHHAL